MHADAVHGQCDINEMFEEFTGELLVHRSFSCTAALEKRAGDESNCPAIPTEAFLD